MVSSMTGFGQAQRSTPWGVFKVEVRSVNHRYLKVTLRLPRGVSGLWLEERLTQLARDLVRRGSVDLSLTWDRGEAATRLRDLNRPAVTHYLALLGQLQSEFGVGGQVDLALLTRLPELFSTSEELTLPQEAWEEIAEVTRTALADLQAMRQAEGDRLREDIRRGLGVVARLLAEVSQRAPERARREEERLSRKLAQLLEDRSVLEDRLRAEVLLYADRIDISEEITRLDSHLDQFRSFLDDDAQVGRRLGFLLQEMQREVNTLGAKANDAPISQRVAQIKEELERIREQVENLE